MTKVADLVGALERLAPTRHAEPWDNVGLLVGDESAPLTRVLVCIDYTPAVAEEVAAERCEAVVAYHPPIFKGVKRLVAGDVVYEAVRRGVAIYSPHTALDVAEGGTNDVLADVLGMRERRPLRVTPPKDTHFKLVTFVPREVVEKVSGAMFEAGAGRIGAYSSCSFRVDGTGTFFGDEGANPAVGEAGRLERADETRVETVVAIGRIEAVVAALRSSHPYEEPAFDLVRLAVAPEGRGLGRVGLVGPVERRELVERVKRGLALDHVMVSGPVSGSVERAACGAGACGDLLDEVVASGAGFYLTGELRHHDALRAAKAGVTVVCTLHSNSERATLARVRSSLEASLPGVAVVASREDRDPFSYL